MELSTKFQTVIVFEVQKLSVCKMYQSCIRGTRIAFIVGLLGSVKVVQNSGVSSVENICDCIPVHSH